MTLENKYNRGTHGDSSHMLSTVVLSNENQTCRGWEAPTSIGGGRMSPPNLEADEKSETGSSCTRQAETCYEV